MPPHTSPGAPLSTLNAQRAIWVDYGKGIGIFFVVVGHVLIGLYNSGLIGETSWLWLLIGWIYSFHMPLFFFLSGLFAARSVQKPLAAFTLDKIKTILYPYFFWSILQISLQISFSTVTFHQIRLSDLYNIYHAPVLQFWFLYILFAIFLIYAILSKIGLSSNHFFLVSLGLYLGFVWLEDWPWLVLRDIAKFTPYFAAAVLFHQPLSRLLSRLSPFGAAALACLLACLSFLLVYLAPSETSHHAHILFFHRWLGPGLAACGITWVVLLATALARTDRFTILRVWGLLSLQIFVAHTIAAAGLRISLSHLFGVSNLPLHLFIGVAVGLYGPITLNWLCRKVGFHYMFSWPKS